MHWYFHLWKVINLPRWNNSNNWAFTTNPLKHFQWHGIWFEQDQDIYIYVFNQQFEITDTSFHWLDGIFSELHVVFNLFDRDGNGTISVSEVKHAMTVMAIDIDEKRVDKVFDDIDTDGEPILYVTVVNILPAK